MSAIAREAGAQPVYWVVIAAVLALAAAGASQLGLFDAVAGLSGSFLGWIPGSPGWWPATVPWAVFAPVVVTLGLVFLVFYYAALDEEKAGTSTQIVSAITAAAAAIILWALWGQFESIGEMVTWALVGLPFILLGYILYVYFIMRQQYPQSTTKNTRKRIESDFSDLSQLVVGLVLFALAIVTGVMSGIAEAWTQAGDLLTPFADGIAYLLTTILGYVALGGSLPGASLVPDLTPLQWAALTLVIGGVALMVRD